MTDREAAEIRWLVLMVVIAALFTITYVNIRDRASQIERRLPPVTTTTTVKR